MKRLLSIILVILLAAAGCKSGNYINTKDSIDDKDEAIIKEFRSHHEYSKDELKSLDIKYLGKVDDYRIYYVPFKGKEEVGNNITKEGYTFSDTSSTRIMGISSGNLYTFGNLINETQINIKKLYDVLPEEFKKQTNDNSSQIGDSSSKVTIESEIKTYSPMMSSVPGLPLEAKLETNKEYKNITFQWSAEQGKFLTWDRSSGKINILGKDVKTNEKKLYWSADFKEDTKVQSFKVFLKVYDSDSSKLICENSIEIEQKKDGFFSVKNK